LRLSIIPFVPNSLLKTRENSWTGNVHVGKWKLEFEGEEFEGGTTSFSGAGDQHGLRPPNC